MANIWKNWNSGKVVICVVAITSLCVSGSRITLTPSELSLKKTGDMFGVQCQLEDIDVSGQNTTSPTWFRVSHGIDEPIPTSGAGVTTRVKGNTSILLFLKAEIKDAGDYKCVGGGMESVISVKLHKSLSFIDTPVTQNPSVGTDAVIRCRVNGDPKPEISWGMVRDGGQHVIAEDGSRFTVLEEGDLKSPITLWKIMAFTYAKPCNQKRVF